MTPLEVSGSVIYAVLLLVIGPGITSALVRGERVAGHVLLVFMISYGGRVALVALNGLLRLLPPKDAGDYALLLFRSLARGVAAPGGGLFGLSPFSLQMVANIPGFLLFGDNIAVILLTNALVGALTGVFAFSYARRLVGERGGLKALWLLSAYPALINFSFFGLRDPLIVLLLTIYAGSTAVAWTEKDGRARLAATIVAILSVGAVLFMRLELLPISLVLPTWLAAARAWSFRS